MISSSKTAFSTELRRDCHDDQAYLGFPSSGTLDNQRAVTLFINHNTTQPTGQETRRHDYIRNAMSNYRRKIENHLCHNNPSRCGRESSRSLTFGARPTQPWTLHHHCNPQTNLLRTHGSRENHLLLQGGLTVTGWLLSQTC